LRDIDWRPGASLEALRVRGAMLTALRAHFADAGMLEVETPLACRSGGTDPNLEPLVANYRGPGFPDGVDLYLQTSPEFPMKRLLAAGSGAIYQICKAFRNGEAGRLHNPEFTILEWYRPGFDLPRLMDEVHRVLELALDLGRLARETVSYAALFARHLGVDVFDVAVKRLQEIAVARHVIAAEQLVLDRDGWLDLLLSHFIQPGLGKEGLCFVVDYPASQAALARLNPDGRTAARFEADNCRRRSAGQRTVPVDRQLLAAMDQGLPDCAGVAVGLDRVLMLRLGEVDLDAVLGFSLERC